MMSYVVRKVWLAGFLVPFAASAVPAIAADLDYPEAPPPPVYERHVVEERPVVYERRVIVERPVVVERRVIEERPIPYPPPYARHAYYPPPIERPALDPRPYPRPYYGRPVPPPEYDQDSGPYAEGPPRPPGYVPY